MRQVRYDFGLFLELKIDDAIVNVPFWMTQADICQTFTCGYDSLSDLKSLQLLLELFRDRLR